MATLKKAYHFNGATIACLSIIANENCVPDRLHLDVMAEKRHLPLDPNALPVHVEIKGALSQIENRRACLTGKFRKKKI
jgi:hypothetical protein